MEMDRNYITIAVSEDGKTDLPSQVRCALPRQGQFGLQKRGIWSYRRAFSSCPCSVCSHSRFKALSDETPPGEKGCFLSSTHRAWWFDNDNEDGLYVMQLPIPSCGADCSHTLISVFGGMEHCSKQFRHERFSTTRFNI